MSLLELEREECARRIDIYNRTHDAYGQVTFLVW